MADRQRSPGPISRHVMPSPAAAAAGGRPSIRQQLIDHLPNSAQVVGFLTLVISGGILLLLTGLTLTAGLLGIIFFAPLVLVTSPIWVPLGAVLFAATVGFLTACGFGVAAVAGATWLYRYVRGRRPVGSGGFDYARSRIADTASHVKDYAREYGGYLQGRVKHAAPGA